MSSLNTPPANTSVSVVHTSLSGGWQLSVDSKERSDILVTLLSDGIKRRTRNSVEEIIEKIIKDTINLSKGNCTSAQNGR